MSILLYYVYYIYIMCIICGCFCLVLQMPLWRSHFDGPVYSYRPMADLAPRAGDEPMRFCLQQKDAEKMSDFFRVGRIISGNAPGNLTGTVRNGTVMSHYPKHIFLWDCMVSRSDATSATK